MKTIAALQKLEKDTKHKYKTEVFITGGYVRDLLRRKSNKDLDIVVRNMNIEEVKKYLEKYGKVKEITIHNVKGVQPVKILLFKTNDDDFDTQISIIKKSGKKSNKSISLKQDSNNRDFTINAMYLPINNISPKKVIDFWGGKNDIQARQILSIGSAKSKFIKSPIRILRAFSLMARTRYSISHHVRSAISECAYLLKKLPGEVIRAELEEILLSHKPSIQLKLMQKLGILKIILPELDKCISCEQDKRYHKYNVFHHLVYSCDNIESDIILRLSVLLHDIGKSIVRNEIDGKITFYKHEVVGAKMAGIILERLKYDTKTIEKVTHLIRMHMYHYTREYTDVGVRRFINNAGVTKSDIENIGNFPLFRIRRAERLGNGLKKLGVTNKQKDFENRIVKIYKESSGLTIKDLAINGNEIMALFKIKPSKNVGKILKYLLELVLEDPVINSKKALLHYALDYFLEESVGKNNKSK